MQTVKTAVNIQNLSVVFDGTIDALKDVSVELPAGRAIGFIGPSGAGKTTLIRSIVGRTKPTSGRVEVLGLSAGSAQLWNRVGYMTQELSVYPDLTVAENLLYFAAILGYGRRAAKEAAQNVLQTVDMGDMSDRLAGTLSGGQKQRVSLAVALIGSPDLMVLDEPTTGLDPVLRDSIWVLFNELKAQGVTLLISSHSMDEAERCDDLLLVRSGMVLAHGTPSALKKQTGAHTVEEAFLELVQGKSRGEAR